MAQINVYKKLNINATIGQTIKIASPKFDGVIIGAYVKLVQIEDSNYIYKLSLGIDTPNYNCCFDGVYWDGQKNRDVVSLPFFSSHVRAKQDIYLKIKQPATKQCIFDFILITCDI